MKFRVVKGRLNALNYRGSNFYRYRHAIQSMDDKGFVIR